MGYIIPKYLIKHQINVIEEIRVALEFEDGQLMFGLIIY